MLNHLGQFPIHYHHAADSLCDGFEAEILQKGNPVVLRYLDQVPEDKAFREALAFEFAAIALENGRADLLQEFLATQDDLYGSAIADACRRFGNSELTSVAYSNQKTKEILGFPETERFLCIREIGSGGLGTVYEALDMARHLPVALKTLRSFGGDTLFRFKQEFRALTGLKHPNLLHLYELFQLDEHWFFTMEFVDGEDILAYCATNGGEDRSLTNRVVFQQLCSGLAALHGQGKLHCDIKPSNILVQYDGVLKILDFGMVSEFVAAWDARNEPVVSERALAGTLAYMAPEQLLGKQLTPASDWYSAGVVLCELLTGCRPVDDSELERLLPPESDLTPLCKWMLKPDPESRPLAEEILNILGDGLPDQQSLSLGETESRFAASEVFVGRARDMARIGALFPNAPADGVALVLVSGVSGLGKTTLTRQFLASLRQRSDTVVLASRCYAHESVRYPGIDGVVDELANFLKGKPSEFLEPLDPRDMHLLIRVFPVLARVPKLAAKNREELEIRDSPRQVRSRATLALQRLLDAVCRKVRVVVYMDDFQWSGNDSISMLVDLLSGDAPPCRFIITCRSEHSGLDAIRTLVKPTVEKAAGGKYDHIALAPFSMTEAAELAQSIREKSGGAPLTEDTCRALYEASSGHPYLISELARSATNAAERQSLSETLEERILNLSLPARALLEVISISGIPLDADTAYQVAQAGKVGAFDPHLTRHLEEEMLVTLSDTGVDGLISPYHDAIRGALFRSMTAEEMRACHHRLAVQFHEKGDSVEPQVTAHHFEQAQLHRPASEYYGKAAAKASDALAFERAAHYYRKTLELAPDLTSANAEQLELELAEALESAGHSYEAAIEFEKLGHLGFGSNQSMLLRHAALLYCSSGHLKQGKTLLERLLARNGIQIPKWRGLSVVRWIFHQAMIRFKLGWMEPVKMIRHEVEPEPASSELTEQIDLLSTAVMGLSIIDTAAVATLQSRSTLLALQCRDSRRLSETLSFSAIYNLAAGWRARAHSSIIDTYAESFCITSSDPYHEGLYLLSKGLMIEHLSLFLEATPILRRAEEIFANQCSRVWWELATVRSCLLWNLCFLGRFSELEPKTYQLSQDARQRSDLFMESNIGCYPLPLVLLAKDEPEAARFTCQSSIDSWGNENGFHVQHQTFLWARSSIYLYEDDALGAQRLFDKHSPQLVRSGLFYIEFIRMWQRDFAAIAGLAVAAQGGRHADLQHIRRAETLVEKLRKMKPPVAPVLAERLGGVLHYLRGEDALATESLKQAIPELHAHGLRAYALSATSLLAEIQCKSLDTRLIEQFRECGIVNPASWRRTQMGI